MNKKHFFSLIAVLTIGITLFSTCKEDKEDYRDKWVGEYTFTIKEYYSYTPDKTFDYYWGKITLGSKSNTLLITYMDPLTYTNEHTIEVAVDSYGQFQIFSANDDFDSFHGKFVSYPYDVEFTIGSNSSSPPWQRVVSGIKKKEPHSSDYRYNWVGSYDCEEVYSWWFMSGESGTEIYQTQVDVTAVGDSSLRIWESRWERTYETPVKSDGTFSYGTTRGHHIDGNFIGDSIYMYIDPNNPGGPHGISVHSNYNGKKIKN